jgi:uncharacterized membrane protein
VTFAAVAAVTSAAAVPPAGGERKAVKKFAMPLRQTIGCMLRAIWLDAGDVERMLGRGWAEQLRQQITQAEADSSAEIRLCVEAALPLRDLLHGGSADFNALVRRRAIGLFGELGVWDTQANTGVLIYVLLGEKAVEIVADRGLGGIASTQWEALAQALAQDLRAGLKEKALATAMARCHQLISTLNLPSDSAGNELPDAPQVR